MEKQRKKTMKQPVKFLLGIAGAMLIGGCAHTAYLGFHGKSVNAFPDIHAGVTRDVQCLECHHPDHAQGSPTPHPDFTGCLNCHND
jgi:hypothetical protein